MFDSALSAIVELETLSPVFIKGKDLDYGEGLLKGPDNTGSECVYLIENDKLCQYIYDKNLTQDYVNYFVRNKSGEHSQEIVNGQNCTGFLDFAGISNFDWDRCKADNNTKSDNLGVVKSDHGKLAIDTKRFRKALGEENKKLVSDFEMYRAFSLEYFLKTKNALPVSASEYQSIAKGITRLSNDSRDKRHYIRNATATPYIPGSSIKGAIRNAVLWKIAKDDNLFPDGSNPFGTEDNSSHLLNQSAFVRNGSAFIENEKKAWEKANDTLRDIFSIVKVSDGHFTGAVQLLPVNIDICCIEKNAADSRRYHYKRDIEIRLEAVAQGATARFRITLDPKKIKSFFGPNPPVYFQSVDKLMQIVHDFFSTLVGFENTFLAGTETIPEQLRKYSFPRRVPVSIDPVIDFYRILSANAEQYRKAAFKKDEIIKLQSKFPAIEALPLQIESDPGSDKLLVWLNSIPAQVRQKLTDNDVWNDFLEKGSYLFRVGWGGGMMSKTQCLLLDRDNRIFARNAKRRKIRSFEAPKSRCIMMNDDKQTAESPLGWCQLKIIPDAGLPEVNAAQFTTISLEPKAELSKEREKLTTHARIKESVPKNTKTTPPYQQGDEIKKAKWKKQDGRYFVQVPGQIQWAELTGKKKPISALYQPTVNGDVTEIMDGIVTKVRSK